MASIFTEFYDYDADSENYFDDQWPIYNEPIGASAPNPVYGAGSGGGSISIGTGGNVATNTNNASGGGFLSGLLKGISDNAPDIVTSAINAGIARDAQRDATNAQLRGAQIQADASTNAANLIRDQYLDTKETLMPFIASGAPAIDRQRAFLGLSGDEAREEALNAAYAGPAFEFRRDRIIDDINRGASARGQLRSGNRYLELASRLNELYATQGNNYFNQLGSLGGMSLSAAQANAGVGTSAAMGQAQATQDAGSALAAGQNAAAIGAINRGAALSGAVGDIGAVIGDSIYRNRFSSGVNPLGT